MSRADLRGVGERARHTSDRAAETPARARIFVFAAIFSDLKATAKWRLAWSPLSRQPVSRVATSSPNRCYDLIMRGLIVLFLGLFAIPAGISAQTPTSNFELEGRSFSLRLENGELRSGPFREVLGVEAVQIDEIQVVGVSAQAALALVHVGSHRILLRKQGARLRTVWTGNTQWRGDLGERMRDVVEVADRNADGFDDIVVGEHIEGRVICGQETTLLSPRAYHLPSRSLVPVTLRRLPEGGAQLTAQTASPGPSGAPIAPLLRARSASSGPSVPFQVLDGSPQSGWIEAAPGSGQWEFVTLALDAGLTLRTLQVVPRLAQASAPRGVWLVGEESQVYVALPETEVGSPLWVELPEPIRGSCLSVVLDASAGPHGGLAELIGYSELDYGGGVDSLVGRFARGPDEARGAAQLLARMGGTAAQAIMRAYPDMPLRERQFAVDVLLHIEDEVATQGLRTAALEPTLRDAVVEGLRSRGDQERLRRLVGEPFAAGEAQAMVNASAGALASLNSQEALMPILGAYAQGHKGVLLNRAFGRIARDGHLAGLEEWAQTSSLDALIQVSVALARAQPDSDLLTTLFGRASEAESFEQRYLLLSAMEQADAAVVGESRQWIEAQMSADEWMLRYAALRSLAPATSQGAFEVGLSDPYPRVRAVAAQRAAGESWAVARIHALATEDTWGFVRAQALTAASRQTPNRWTARGLNDPHETVRAAAIRIQLRQTRAIDPEVAQRINRRLADDDEWPVVLQAGVELARGRCEPSLVEGLVSIVERGMRPSAWAPDEEVASSAIVALAAIASPQALEAVQRAAAAAPGPVQRVAAGADQVETCSTTQTTGD